MSRASRIVGKSISALVLGLALLSTQTPKGHDVARALGMDTYRYPVVPVTLGGGIGAIGAGISGLLYAACESAYSRREEGE